MPDLPKFVDGDPSFPEELREMLRACWSCGNAYALRYRAQESPSRLTRE